ncbi:hypothetical protein [Nonomuraea sp. NPDC001699]
MLTDHAVFTPTAADAAFTSPGGRGPVDRLGMLVQLRTLPWLGSWSGWAVPPSGSSRC